MKRVSRVVREALGQASSANTTGKATAEVPNTVWLPGNPPPSFVTPSGIPTYTTPPGGNTPGGGTPELQRFRGSLPNTPGQQQVIQTQLFDYPRIPQQTQTIITGGYTVPQQVSVQPPPCGYNPCGSQIQGCRQIPFQWWNGHRG